MTRKQKLVSQKATQLLPRKDWVSAKVLKRNTIKAFDNMWGVMSDVNVSVPDKDDVEFTSDEGLVCFRSGWNISSSASVTLEPQGNNRYCYKPNVNEICTTVGFSFSSGNCSGPIVLNKNLTASGTSLFHAHLQVFDCVLCRP